MNKTIRLIPLALLLTLLASPLHAQRSAAALDPTRNDPFSTEHQALGLNPRDLTLERKEPSWWWSPKCNTPAEQFAHAQALEDKGSLRRARNAYNDLVHEWGASPYAGKAQYRLAKIYERQGALEAAYEAYLYLIAYHAGQCPYEEALDATFRNANAILAENQSFLGIPLTSDAFHRENFERILYYAPRWHRAPDVLIRIAALHEADKDYPLAAKVYDTLIARFPQSPHLNDAILRSATCHYTQALREPENIARCRDSILAIRALTIAHPNHPQRTEIQRYLDELIAKHEALRYQSAAFYDNPRYTPAVTISAYRQFLKEFPHTTRRAAIEQRIRQLKP